MEVLLEPETGRNRVASVHPFTLLSELTLLLEILLILVHKVDEHVQTCISTSSEVCSRVLALEPHCFPPVRVVIGFSHFFTFVPKYLSGQIIQSFDVLVIFGVESWLQTLLEPVKSHSFVLGELGFTQQALEHGLTASFIGFMTVWVFFLDCIWHLDVRI